MLYGCGCANRYPVVRLLRLPRLAPAAGAHFALRRGRPSGTPCSAWTRSPPGECGSRTTSSRPGRKPRWARVAGVAINRAALLVGRLRRRLRVRARLPAARERRRRDLLDGRHRRHPADPAEADRSRSPAARLRVDRSAGAARAAPKQADAAPVSRRSSRASAVVAYSEHEAATLSDWLGPGGPEVVFVAVRRRRRRLSPGRGSRSGRRRAVRRRRPAPRLRAPAPDRRAQP